jgi:hypothetical protein
MKFESPEYRVKKETALNKVISSDPVSGRQAFEEIVQNQKEDNPSKILFRNKIPKAVKRELQKVDFENTIHDLLYEYGLHEAVDTKIDDILTPTFLGKFLADDMRDLHVVNIAGFFSMGTDRDSVVVTPRGIRLPQESLMGVIVHEVIHRNSFNSITQYRNLDSSGSHYAIRRSGIMSVVGGRENDHVDAYVWLNEAVTDELTARYMNRYLGVDWKSMDNTYGQFRKTLIKIIDLIYERFPEKYTSTEEVFKLFSRAALNGRLLPVARAIEKALGRKAFREMVKYQFAENRLNFIKRMNSSVPRVE